MKKLLNTMRSLPIKCTKDDCPWEGALKDIDKHFETLHRGDYTEQTSQDTNKWLLAWTSSTNNPCPEKSYRADLEICTHLSPCGDVYYPLGGWKKAIQPKRKTWKTDNIARTDDLNWYM